jgi:hypothetical protein
VSDEGAQPQLLIAVHPLLPAHRLLAVPCRLQLPEVERAAQGAGDEQRVNKKRVRVL